MTPIERACARWNMDRQLLTDVHERRSGADQPRFRQFNSTVVYHCNSSYWSLYSGSSMK